MEFDVYGPEAADDGRDCLFVLGWGSRPDHEPVQWLVDALRDADWRVHLATLPNHVTDVRDEWVEPVERYATDLDEFALLGHSAGGLAAAHVEADGVRTRTYLSPWWGYPPATRGLTFEVASKLPVHARFLPSTMDDKRLLGEHATERQLAAIPDRVSPAFLRATRAAQRALPATIDDAVVFCSLSDRIISTRAIGDRVPSDRIILYDGGHELFSARSRETYVDALRVSLASGLQSSE